MKLKAHRLHLGLEDGGAVRVCLSRQKPREELDDAHGTARLPQGVTGLETQDPAADNQRTPVITRVLSYLDGVIERHQRENSVLVRPRYSGNKAEASGGYQ